LLKFFKCPHNSAADGFVLRRESASEIEKVLVTTIDNLVGDLKLETVDFIKMDIEGTTLRALIVATRTTSQYRLRLAISTEEENR
jgi:FkbM family methyltransferase